MTIIDNKSVRRALYEAANGNNYVLFSVAADIAERYIEQANTEHVLSLERIQHDYTKAKLKATEEAYGALQRQLANTALVKKIEALVGLYSNPSSAFDTGYTLAAKRALAIVIQHKDEQIALVKKLVDALDAADKQIPRELSKPEGFFTRWLRNPVKDKIKEALTEATAYLERINHDK